MEAMSGCAESLTDSERTRLRPSVLDYNRNVRGIDASNCAENFQQVSVGKRHEFRIPLPVSGGHADIEDTRVRCCSGLSRRALMRAYAFMEEHLGESFTLEELARAACVSRFHFARSFRSSTGDSPMAYLLKARIERAKQMLMRGDHTISDTAASLGFFDQSHFARTFRRLTGFSPREFARLWDDLDVRTML